jgi:hypothetical protein
MGNVQLMSLECKNANTIRFRLPIFASDVDLQQTACTLHASACFVPKRFLDTFGEHTGEFLHGLQVN